MNVEGASLEKCVDPNSGGRCSIHHKSEPRDLLKPILVLFKEQISKLVIIHENQISKRIHASN